MTTFFMHGSITSTLKVAKDCITIGISYLALSVSGYMPILELSRVCTSTYKDGLDEKETTTEVS